LLIFIFINFSGLRFKKIQIAGIFFVKILVEYTFSLFLPQTEIVTSTYTQPATNM